MAQVFHAECHYDAIIGRNVLNQIGILFDFTVFWDKSKVAMHQYMPGEGDEATASSVNSTIKITSLAEKIMLDLLDDVYDDEVTTRNYKENDDHEAKDGSTSEVRKLTRNRPKHESTKAIPIRLSGSSYH